MMAAASAADVLRRTLANPEKPFTVADASVASGLPLRDAEAGLNLLTSEYRGHLRVTEDGDLVHLFPTGFTKPWQTQEFLAKVAGTVGRALVAVGRFVVRAWLLIVMVSYALLFLALMIGLTVTRQGSSDDRNGSAGLGIVAALFRMLADALFWTFHPFSPLYIDRAFDHVGTRRAVRSERENEDDEPKVAFYEKVNRFVFGPPVPKEDPHQMHGRVLAEIRALKGRIGLADVMRVTGLPRDQADPLMAKLMLDYDGEVSVGESGGIVYTFESLRRSTNEAAVPRPPAAWARVTELLPLTGNDPGANILVALLNGFNLLVSAWVMQNGLTISNIALLFERHRPRVLPDDGLPLALGLVPFVFSLFLFVLPIGRAIHRARMQKRADQERARLAVLREVVSRASKSEPVADETLRAAVRIATGEEPTSADITRRVVDLGGDVDVGPEGEVRYRFAGFEADAQAAEEERERADDREGRIGAVVFASDQ
jgi:hypothetical protein